MTPADLAAFEARIAAMTDAEVLAEYMASEDEAGDERQDLLAGELERRQVDF